MVLTYIEHTEGQIKKSSLECLRFAREMADQQGDQVGAVILGSVSNETLGNHGADVVIKAGDDTNLASDSRAMTKLLGEIADQKEANYIVVSHNSFGKGVAGRLAVRRQAGLVSGVTQLPSKDGNWSFQKSVFSGKAYAKYSVPGEKIVVSIMPNSFGPMEYGKAGAYEEVSVDVSSSLTVVERNQETGTVALPEAELVVSAGRGMKGPENWGIVEELAELLGATTACSRPVADADWRPHHEHVGQTGIAIRPNLYIAIGISGAIQHLAGVNNSKTIVVINKDPEAPFFKAADYGVCADLFDVVPRLNEAIRKYKS